ncbi:MAG: TonB-dependent receptor [Flavobacteriales bacterium TMED191]|nr:MAG: TonB-dependent receptor [Flavobacteriales bacterium TMED191]
MTRISFFYFLLVPIMFYAQTGTIRGFVYEKESEEPIIFANIVLEGTDLGVVSDDNGYFIIPNVQPGNYTLKASFIGYNDSEQIVIISTDNLLITTKFFLTEQSITLQNVTVNAEREEQKKQVNTGVIKLTSKSINKLPSIGGEPDIAQFLQVLPGVIFTGDQGGQLYIRGGAPIHNKVLLDGMTIYSPFHSIGFFSVFDTDIIKKADVYTGGFGAQYGGRISSVMDIKTRDGNKKRLTGKLSMNTFGSKFLLEGPMFSTDSSTFSNSFLFSAKSSYLDKTSKYFYSYVDTVGLPYSFSDFYGKFSFFSKNGSKFNLYGFGFNDNVNYVDLTNLGWNTYGFGSNIVLVPSSAKMLIEGKLSYSKYDISQQDVGEPVNNSNIDGFNVGLNFLYFISQKHELKYGVEVLGYTTELYFRNAIAALIEERDHSTEFAGYFHYKFNDNNRFIMEPSLRLQNYTSLGETSLEPRLGLKYNVNENFRLKSSFGKFSQNLMSTSSERDVVNLFSGFLSSTNSLPEYFNGNEVQSSLQRSTHYILGLEYDLGAYIDINIEGYIKDFSQLISENKNQVFDDTPEFENQPDFLKKDFIVEKGIASGFDVLLKYVDNRLNIWSVYSYGIIEREDELQVYSPHYDRRHNFNFVFSYLVDKAKTWEFSLRWNYGSGFPFTKTQAYYEELNLYNELDTDINVSNGELGILYSDLNSGRLPDYHRLDMSIKKTYNFSKFNILEITLGVTNCYNRNNIFYFDRVNAIRVDQLPIIPSIGLSWKF